MALSRNRSTDLANGVTAPAEFTAGSNYFQNYATATGATHAALQLPLSWAGQFVRVFCDVAVRFGISESATAEVDRTATGFAKVGSPLAANGERCFQMPAVTPDATAIYLIHEAYSTGVISIELTS